MIWKRVHNELFHDSGHYLIETIQWTGFYMIVTTVMKEFMCFIWKLAGRQLISCKRPVSLKILQVIKSAQEIFVKDLLNLEIAKGLFKEDWYFIITKEN